MTDLMLLLRCEIKYNLDDMSEQIIPLILEQVSGRMSHTCHWPDCKREVPPATWGCKPHWFRLPKYLRDKVWAAYVPGQEITKTPSEEYISVAHEVQDWIKGHDS